MRTVLLFVVFVSWVPNVWSTDWRAVHEKTIAAIDHLYDLDFATSEKTCNEVIGMAPGDPRGHFVKSMVYYYRMTFQGGAKNDTLYYAFLYHANKVETVCSSLLEQNSNDAKALSYYGGTIGYKGLAHYRRGEMIKAIWEGKKGYGLLERAYALDPQNGDAKMGLGLFQYMISQAPSEVRSLIELAGMSGDRASGLRRMEEAAQHGLYAKQEAHRWLVDFYQAEDMPNRAMSHAQVLADRYQRNWWFQHTASDIALFHLHRPERAEPYLLRLSTMQTAQNNEQYVRSLGRLRLGYLNVLKERYVIAGQYFLSVVNGQAEDAQKQEAAFQLGNLMELQGRASEAPEWYRKAGGRKDAQARLATPMNVPERSMFRIQNAYLAGDNLRAIALTDSCRAAGALSSNRNLAIALYFQGTCLNECKQYGRAESTFLEALRYAEMDANVRPYCHWRLGLSYARQDKVAQAKEQWQRALAFDGYQSEETLRRRVQREQAALP
jgi:tetratricopeptide (TPR) repeat protein